MSLRRKRCLTRMARSTPTLNGTVAALVPAKYATLVLSFVAHPWPAQFLSINRVLALSPPADASSTFKGTNAGRCQARLLSRSSDHSLYSLRR